MDYTSEEAGREAVDAATAPNQSPTKEVDMAPAKRITPPAFQFYASDFLSSDKVSRMSAAERGAYITLLCHAWLAHGLPNDHQQIGRYLRMSASQVKRLWAGPLGECFTLKGGRLVNPRQERIRVDLLAFIDRQTANGKLGGRPRKATANPGETQALPTQKPNETSSVFSLPSSSSTPKEQEQKISAEPLNGSSPTVMTFPTVGPSSTWGLTSAQLVDWQVLFPNVDVMAEMRKAVAWLPANPAKRKTAKGMPRFLVAWLTRAVDNGNGHSSTRVATRISAAQEPTFEPWACPHVEDHTSRWRCDQATALNRPRKADA